MKIKKIVIFIIAFLMAAITVALLVFFLPQQKNNQVSEEIAKLLRNAKIQPFNEGIDSNDFTLQLLNGGNVTLSSYKGKVVLLNFWATWCPPCREEMPSMETLYQRYKSQGLEILAVDLREDENTIRQFIQRYGYTFPILLDSNGWIGNVYGVQAIPTSFIVNRDGKIIGRVVGSIYWDTPQVFALIEALL